MWLNPKSDRRFVDHVASDRFALVLGFIGRLASRMLAAGAAGGGAAIRAAGSSRQVGEGEGARCTRNNKRAPTRAAVAGPRPHSRWPAMARPNGYQRGREVELTESR